MFLAVMKATPDGRIAKYAEFETEAEANAHVERFSNRWPDAFVVPRPDGSFMDWKAEGRAVVVDPRPVVKQPDFPNTREIWEIGKAKGHWSDQDRLG